MAPVVDVGQERVQLASWAALPLTDESQAMEQGVERKREAILDVAARHGARNVRIFGSVARGDDRPDSDVDFLVDMEADRSLLDLIGLSQELEALLERKVDVLTDQSLAPSVRQRIANEARAL